MKAMKKVALVIGFMGICSVSWGAVFVASGGAAASQRASQELSAQRANASNLYTNGAVRGVMTCGSTHISNNYGYVYDGCDYWSKKISIQRYFDLFKPEGATEIVSVVFNDSNTKFIIYYK